VTSSLRNKALFGNQQGMFLVPRFIKFFHPFVRRLLLVLPQEQRTSFQFEGIEAKRARTCDHFRKINKLFLRMTVAKVIDKAKRMSLLGLPPI